jgi:hypothetical protein
MADVIHWLLGVSLLGGLTMVENADCIAIVYSSLLFFFKIFFSLKEREHDASLAMQTKV